MSKRRSGSIGWLHGSVLSVAGGALALALPAAAHADDASLDFGAAAAQQEQPYFADAEPVGLFEEDGTPRHTMRFADANGANQAQVNDQLNDEPLFEDEPADDRTVVGPFALYDRDDFYAAGSLGLSLSSESALDAGLALNGVFGYAWQMVRFEGDLGFRYHNVDASGIDGDFYTIAFMGNALIDFDVIAVDELDFYTGFGLGLVHGSIDIDVDTVMFVPGVGVMTSTENVDDSSTDFAFQWMIGSNYAITDQISVFGGYRLLSVNTTNIGSTQFHTLEAGARFMF